MINKLQEKVEEYDLRAIIFAILYRTGFDRNELQPHETQRLEVIQVYPHFKMGEIWNDIKWELEQDVSHLLRGDIKVIYRGLSLLLMITTG